MKIEMGQKDPIGGAVPYSEVFGEYAAGAAAAMDRENIPDSLRELVEKYFTGLE